MDGVRNSKERSVKRRHETNRLEDQVWALAFEQLWPLFRKVLNENRTAPQNDLQAAPSAAVTVARSA